MMMSPHKLRLSLLSNRWSSLHLMQRQGPWHEPQETRHLQPPGSRKWLVRHGVTGEWWISGQWPEGWSWPSATDFGTSPTTQKGQAAFRRDPWFGYAPISPTESHTYAITNDTEHFIGFYPRPVLAFGYCRCLRLCVCVCVSVRMCVNHLLVRAITRDLFKLGSPNLDQRCKRPWLRSLLFWGAIDLDLQGQI